MTEIFVRQLSESNDVFKVTVKDSDSARDFKVQLNDNYFQALMSNKKISKKALIKKSFEFLLARESKEQILREFNLSEIQRYFPDFKKEIML